MKDDSVSRNGHVCGICEKSFTKKRNMLLHRVMHSANKIFKCSFCTYKFHRKDQLEDHWLSHVRTVRRLDCPVLLCGFVTSAAYKLRSHLMTNHKISPINPAICRHCNCIFKSCRGLIIHYHTGDLFSDKYAGGFSRRSGSSNSHVKKMPINRDDSTPFPQSYIYDSFKAWSETFAQINSDTIAHLEAKLVHSGILDLEAFSNVPATTSNSKPQSQIEAIMAEHSYCLPYPRDPPAVVVNVSNVTSDGSERPLASPASPSVYVVNREGSVDSDCSERPMMIASSSDQLEKREDSPDVFTSTQSDNTFPVGASAHSPVRCVRCEVEGNEKLECPLCKITYQDEALFLLHMGFHSHVDPYRCNMCGFKSVNRIEFNVHLWPYPRSCPGSSRARLPAGQRCAARAKLVSTKPRAAAGRITRAVAGQQPGSSCKRRPTPF